jgi:hypothetical protein
MRLTLPKRLLRYVKPIDQGHEFRLALMWREYKSCARDGQPSFLIEQAILGNVFGIPEDQWYRFRSKPSNSHAAVLKEVKRFAEQYVKRQRERGQAKKSATTMKVTAPKRATVILRKHRPE